MHSCRQPNNFRTADEDMDSDTAQKKWLEYLLETTPL